MRSAVRMTRDEVFHTRKHNVYRYVIIKCFNECNLYVLAYIHSYTADFRVVMYIPFFFFLVGIVYHMYKCLVGTAPVLSIETEKRKHWVQFKFKPRSRVSQNARLGACVAVVKAVLPEPLPQRLPWLRFLPTHAARWAVKHVHVHRRGAPIRPPPTRPFRRCCLVVRLLTVWVTVPHELPPA